MAAGNSAIVISNDVKLKSGRVFSAIKFRPRQSLKNRRRELERHQNDRSIVGGVLNVIFAGLAVKNLREEKTSGARPTLSSLRV